METSPASWLQNLTHLSFSFMLLPPTPPPPLSLQEGGFYACSLLSHWIFHKNTAFPPPAPPPNRHCWLSHGNVLTFMLSCSLESVIFHVLSPSFILLCSILFITGSFFFFFKYCSFPDTSAQPFLIFTSVAPHLFSSYSFVPLSLSPKQVVLFFVIVS